MLLAKVSKKAPEQQVSAPKNELDLLLNQISAQKITDNKLAQSVANIFKYLELQKTKAESIEKWVVRCGSYIAATSPEAEKYLYKLCDEIEALRKQILRNMKNPPKNRLVNLDESILLAYLKENIPVSEETKRDV
jgi:hypothetical protein